MNPPFHISAAPETPCGAYCLAQWRFGADEVRSPHVIAVPLRVLSGPDTQTWLSDTPVRRRHVAGIECADNSEVLLARLNLDDPPDGDWRALAAEAYRRIAAFQAGSDYPALLRVWNFMAGITEGAGDNERYRRFALGRYEAWELAQGIEARLPAATAIGTHARGLQLVWLASRRRGLQVENPRQTSAFRYPREYGPRSPSFSRATLHRSRGGDRLYVSGTASIVGHRSLHAGDVLEQLDEIHRNLSVLAAEAARRAGHAEAMVAKALTVYVRRAADAARVAQRVRERFGEAVPLWVLEGEVCRRELLVEIEALYGAASAGGAT
ncbi:hypothetical protein RM530_11015 [Algiphilus sp. W345]|uniref:Chorismatase FkbO/Hyg5-like N-terminal domain-containing protein n=1 Tax=Banduia mediterranea TaxID=3075609 RepID=A0ABU2WJ43_9GAMM|nr:hypothetical protein [Algiphilus sp. W345]MDT0497888.1 hypothetical protein [Algiphilus sp. W345]